MVILGLTILLRKPALVFKQILLIKFSSFHNTFCGYSSMDWFLDYPLYMDKKVRLGNKIKRKRKKINGAVVPT